MSKGLLAVLREDNFDIGLLELGFVVPEPAGVRETLKAKTTKTP